MQLVIIAGGKGTRLGLKDIPKPMVKIGDKPLLEHQIDLAKRYGVDEVFILSGHLANVIEEYFGDGSKFGVKIHHVIEPYPLGTAGSLKLLEGKLNDRFLVFYGDVVMDFDIASFVEFDKQYDSIGTTIIHPNDHPYDSDLLEINKNNKVTKVLPKPHQDGEYYQNLVNAAVYIFSQKIFEYIEEGVSQDFGKHILSKVVDAGETLIGYKTPEYIKDMGTADRFEAVKSDFLTGKVARLNKQNKRPCIFLDRDGVINKDMDSKPLCKDFELLDGVAEAIKSINKSDYLSVVVTNQPMIAKGFVTFEEVENTHKKMETLLGEQHAYLNGIYYCPHHPEKGFDGEIKELKIDCECRKPKAGMLFKATKDLNIDLENSWMIGDSQRDIDAGKNANCRTISIKKDLSADYIAQDLKDAVNYILKGVDNE
ncbi:MAG: D,D-heptose 1,7-bisphosphate phosphatase [Candidatus Melainabacteria bacterium]|nr:MAG: D,D-heptose 1,7-bisphosphate phosphatase [Candidatus Melainabacteria bacterium]